MVKNIKDTESDIPQFMQFALDGADFSPMEPDIDPEPNPARQGFDILSGSQRQKIGYSAVLGMMVEVTEVIATVQDSHGVKGDIHHLLVEYDDRAKGVEYSLDARAFVVNDDDASNIVELKGIVMKALGAVAEDRLL